MTSADIDPRVLRTREIVVQATSELLTEVGFSGITIEAIAERCGVARSTIYRNWPERAELLIDAFDRLCSVPAVPDTGSLKQDLLELGTELASGLSSSKWGRCLPSLIGAVAGDEELQVAQIAFSRRRHQTLAAVFQQAQGRGEIADDLDPSDLAEQFAGPFFLRRLISHRPLDSDFVARRIEMIQRAAT